MIEQNLKSDFLILIIVLNFTCWVALGQSLETSLNTHMLCYSPYKWSVWFSKGTKKSCTPSQPDLFDLPVSRSVGEASMIYLSNIQLYSRCNKGSQRATYSLFMSLFFQCKFLLKLILHLSCVLSTKDIVGQTRIFSLLNFLRHINYYLFIILAEMICIPYSQIFKLVQLSNYPCTTVMHLLSYLCPMHDIKSMLWNISGSGCL